MFEFCFVFQNSFQNDYVFDKNEHFFSAIIYLVSRFASAMPNIFHEILWFYPLCVMIDALFKHVTTQTRGEKCKKMRKYIP